MFFIAVQIIMSLLVYHCTQDNLVLSLSALPGCPNNHPIHTHAHTYNNKDKVETGRFLTWLLYYTSSICFYATKQLTTMNKHYAKKIKKTKGNLMEQQSPIPSKKHVHFMIQDLNEWEHVRLGPGFVQFCYQRGATMAGKTEHKVFYFSRRSKPSAGAARESDHPDTGLLSLLRYKSPCMFVGSIFFFFFGSEHSSLPRR